MFNVQMSWTNMELLPLVCLCLLTWSGTTFADGNDPGVIRVLEDNDAVLPCSFGSVNIEHQVFDWKKDGLEVFIYDNGRTYGNGMSGQDKQFEGRVEHFPNLLKSGNASIVIRPAKLADSGSYTCISVQNGVSTTRSRIELIVGAAPKPRIRTLDETKDGVLLQCELEGASPKPLVQFQDRAGNILPAKDPQVSERGGHYDIILQTTVTKTNHYRCVATQKEINHETFYETYVPVHASSGVKLLGSDDVSRKVMIGLIAAVLAELL